MIQNSSAKVPKVMLALACILMAALCASTAHSQDDSLSWPVWPDSSFHVLGNDYGQYQRYTGPGSGFMHTGIDIMVPESTEVYAVKPGWVKAILTTSGDQHWRVVVADSAGSQPSEAFLYAHLIENSIKIEAALTVGDYVEAGQFLGRIVHFDPGIVGLDFNHIHFSKIRPGGSWSNYVSWEFIRDPLKELALSGDIVPPQFENTVGADILAFAVNESAVYLPSTSTLSGALDIICKVQDTYGGAWRIAPRTLEYKLVGPDTTDWLLGANFDFELGTYGSAAQQNVNSLYKDDATCLSEADYLTRNYYFVVTNNDGDSALGWSDGSAAWNTAEYNNGAYTVSVRATDASGNASVVSIGVTIANYFSLSGQILTSDAADPAGTIVTITNTGEADTTSGTGAFQFSSVGGGSKLIQIRKDGYWPIDTVLMMSSNQQLNLTLELLIDTDGDGFLDDVDNCRYVHNPDQSDIDGDQVGDLCDNCEIISNSSQADSDFDQVGDLCDNCINAANPNQTDTDSDLLGDSCDNCTAVYNPGQVDSDFDGIGDSCDTCTDTDNDGFGNPEFTANSCPDDNCPDSHNPDQVDADNDGVGDVCDSCTDTDGDGFGNPGYGNSSCPDDNCPSHANPGQKDFDSDGVGDACCCLIRGDANNDGARDITDLTFYVDFMFAGGDSSPCPEAGDMNDDGAQDITDLTFFVDFLFAGGEAPPPCP
ncbi:MAG: thrombospondin type 3 repeat-containing protein [bacterium]|nr:thrombospondin type 3 repeat-containing protein [bacterium]